jgi:FtsH-binding integral membrane protein
MTDYTKKYRNQFVRVAYLLMAISLILSVSCASQTTYVKYSPVANEGIHNKELGHNVSIAILDFPDRRLDSEGKKT